MTANRKHNATDKTLKYVPALVATLVFCLFILLSGCKQADKEFDKVAITKQYFQVLDNSDVGGIAALLKDSLYTKETEYDYQQTFSLQEYVDWLKWDAAFDPTYKILEIVQEKEVVKTKVSKMDTRIAFLHQQPIVTQQVFRFDKDKITSIETTKYEVFNDTVFASNRRKLLNFIDKNHPELNGFIFDQTEEGAQNYLKAIALYNNSRALQGDAEMN